jgi:hypothetical protein
MKPFRLPAEQVGEGVAVGPIVESRDVVMAEESSTEVLSVEEMAVEDVSGSVCVNVVGTLVVVVSVASVVDVLGSSVVKVEKLCSDEESALDVATSELVETVPVTGSAVVSTVEVSVVSAGRVVLD